MNTHDLISKFLKSKNIPFDTTTTYTNPIQIYYQFKIHTDNIIKESSDFIENAHNSKMLTRKIKKKNKKSNEDFNCDINDMKAESVLKMLNDECSDEEDLYYSDEVESNENNE